MIVSRSRVLHLIILSINFFHFRLPQKHSVIMVRHLALLLAVALACVALGIKYLIAPRKSKQLPGPKGQLCSRD